MSAAVLDLRPGRSRDAGPLVGVGLAAAAPTALAGAVDWAELHRQQQRVGLVQAMTNTAAVGPYAASLACRVKGREAAGRTFGFPFPAGQLVRRSVDDVPVLVVREPGGTIHALAERCSHLAGPLSEGTVADGCVQCPWHGSVFRLSDGWNLHGPATAPQPAFDTRIVDGHVDVRLRQEPAANDANTDRTRTRAEAGTAHGHGS